MLELTPSILNAIDSHIQPLRMIDPRTDKEFILLPVEQFEQIMANLQDKLDVDGAYPIMDDVARREGWDDPETDIYNDLSPPCP